MVNDKAVETIAAKIYADWGVSSGGWEARTDREKEAWLHTARAILSDPDIPIIEYEPDAELPKNPYDLAENVGMVDGRVANFHQQRSQGYKRCRQDMLKAGWVKEKK